ncbi:MAG: alanine racemase [Pseudomonadales bacterium]|nr:alanine racemase [Pseudomonadales bacterium]MDP6469905.1 alanine racemase [Pseudomonadales bacterium]MDP6827493.1 alanine racemase [Pseudomonadales bacterium]MDP6970767.1 alanine racemase [Pseudomonadales bacterium]
MTARLRVDLKALEHNYRKLCDAAGSLPETAVRVPRTGAVVKANAYGMGLEPVARVLWRAGCREFFVASAAEGRWLRRCQPDAVIYVFEGVLPETIATLVEARLIPVVNHAVQLSLWKSHRALPIAIHVDTGMHRLGFRPDHLDAAMFGEFRVALLMTHFACADQTDHPANQRQAQRFFSVCESFPGVPISLCNSAATLANLAIDDVRRPGIALYGGNPFSDADNPMSVVARLEGQVVQVRSLDAGELVGYDWTYRAERPRRVAVVGLGYADGLPRSLSNCGQAGVAGVVCPIIGRVTMDLTVLDVTEVPVQTGDWVEFFGAGVGVDEVGRLAGSFAYELFCGVGSRVQRLYSSNASASETSSGGSGAAGSRT